MMVRVSQSAEAVKLLGMIRGVDEATNQVTLAIEAQVHATLALVEQQRIANRIALAAHELQVHGRVMVTDHGILDNPKSVDGYLNVKPEIKAALS